jgi:hypothetical protein
MTVSLASSAFNEHARAFARIAKRRKPTFAGERQ